MNILGLMSGSSLDGLDMALCNFRSTSSDFIEFEILETKQVVFPDILVKRLSSAVDLDGKDLMKLDGDFGRHLGNRCLDFISGSKHHVDVIASHGHTVFHFPELGFTTQIGNGGVISQLAQRRVICDFRSSDIGAGGLGAPCAPIADKLLFQNIDIFINIGGISNLTSIEGDEVKAFDISPANQLLNYLASLEGRAFDEDGKIAAKGMIDQALLKVLIESNALEDDKPRALDNSWVQDSFIPILEGIEVRDAMRTVVEFICLEIRRAIGFLGLVNKKHRVMVSGGGAFNKFLMKRLEEIIAEQNCRIIEISHELINYKEAVLIALMGYLRQNKIPNVIKNVTGSSRNTIGGCIYEY